MPKTDNKKSKILSTYCYSFYKSKILISSHYRNPSGSRADWNTDSLVASFRLHLDLNWSELKKNHQTFKTALAPYLIISFCLSTFIIFNSTTYNVRCDKNKEKFVFQSWMIHEEWLHRCHRTYSNNNFSPFVG